MIGHLKHFSYSIKDEIITGDVVFLKDSIPIVKLDKDEDYSLGYTFHGMPGRDVILHDKWIYYISKIENKQVLIENCLPKFITANKEGKDSAAFEKVVRKDCFSFVVCPHTSIVYSLSGVGYLEGDNNIGTDLSMEARDFNQFTCLVKINDGFIASGRRTKQNSQAVGLVFIDNTFLFKASKVYRTKATDSFLYLTGFLQDGIQFLIATRPKAIQCYYIDIIRGFVEINVINADRDAVIPPDPTVEVVKGLHLGHSFQPVYIEEDKRLVIPGQSKLFIIKIRLRPDGKGGGG